MYDSESRYQYMSPVTQAKHDARLRLRIAGIIHQQSRVAAIRDNVTTSFRLVQSWYL